MTLVVLLGSTIEQLNTTWSLVDNDLFIKAIVAHCVIIFSFTITYFFFSGQVRKEDLISKHYTKEIFHSNLFIYIAITLFLIMGLSAYFRFEGKAILFWLGNLKEVAEIISIGIIASKFSTKKSALLFIFIFTIIYSIIPQILFSTEGIEINRGRPISIIISSACYINIVKWNGSLVSTKLFFIAISGGLIMLGGLNILEAIFAGDQFSMYDLFLGIFLSFEPGIFDNAATIISWIDNKSTDLRNGLSYLYAFDGLNLFPFTGSSLSDWFAWERNPSYAATGGRYNFGAVAEGYLNGKFIGVFFHGFLVGLIASMIRRMKYSKYLYPYNPIFFSYFLLVINVLNRKDLKAVIGTIELFFIGMIILLLLIELFIGSTKHFKFSK